MNLDKLKYPIGCFIKPDKITNENISIWIEVIAAFPEALTSQVANLTDVQLDTPYRPDGWTIRQVIHHCADSHMNSFTRFKLALTEDKPFIKPYHEERWAELIDSKTFPIESSLQMLKGIHSRWTALLMALSKSDLNKSFVHPEHGQTFFLDENIGIYAWHCNHHLAHITTLKETKGWS
ncbi:YfiT family bacillithiol transferase [Flavobacterium algicola]|uniref:YfiT family bacillithiol transferase n=1 Tax=Flavobacterium algicola TaxID=556529 RepID=UPI001EFCA972|nr:putative metal-dependent hydrolase [Flavobacterium algicola]MCG9792817.1 putative metal-dependent hydrolase [Flavobacterium algicola]